MHKSAYYRSPAWQDRENSVSKNETVLMAIFVFTCMAQQKEITSTVNGLIETLKDGEEGFKEAADAVKDRS